MDSQESSREHSFCNRAMESEGVFVVPDAQADPRFCDNPHVTGGAKIRFYAGAPLRSSNGHQLGAVCVVSDKPRDNFSDADQGKLQVLARIVETEMELRLQARQAHQAMFDKDLALREAHYRIKNSLDYATLLSDIQSDDMTTEKLSLLAMAAWKQYTEAGAVLNGAVKSLRKRMSVAEYRELIDNMPGFAI
jgi:GAF domain-containing protein